MILQIFLWFLRIIQYIQDTNTFFGKMLTVFRASYIVFVKKIDF